MRRKLLLASGIVARLLYAVADVVAGMRWEANRSPPGQGADSDEEASGPKELNAPRE